MIKKRFLLILCAAFMLLSLFGCTKNNKTSQSTPIGSLQLAIDYVFKVSYNNDGLVTALTGLSGPSTGLATGYSTAVGTACETVVTTLVQTIVDSGDCQNTQVIVLKQAPNSKVPSDTFLEKIRTDIEAVAGGLSVLLITADQLTAKGLISADTAVTILTKHLSLADAEITCAETPENGKYTLTVTHQGVISQYLVDADTGIVIPPM